MASWKKNRVARLTSSNDHLCNSLTSAAMQVSIVMSNRSVPNHDSFGRHSGGFPSGLFRGSRSGFCCSYHHLAAAATLLGQIASQRIGLLSKDSVCIRLQLRLREMASAKKLPQAGQFAHSQTGRLAAPAGLHLSPATGGCIEHQLLCPISGR